MAACEIQISNPAVLEKIESFMNDPGYSEIIESSASYNTRISVERRMRMPFLDSHTGVAQNHSDLFKSERQRMPGFIQGQVYTYPSKRWCKRRRQYLMNWTNPRRNIMEDGDSNTGDNPIVNEDSKDSAGLKEETGKDSWYYDDEMIEMDGYDEPDPDSDFDYEDSYRSRKKKSKAKPKNRGGRQTAVSSPKGDPETPASGGRGGRGRKRALLYDMDNDKPFACELCSARYKTRPGLTYHYTHTHKETKECDVPTSDGGDSSSMDRGSPKQGAGVGVVSSGPAPAPVPVAMTHTTPTPAVAMPPGKDGAGGETPGSGQFQDSYLTFLKVPGNRARGGRQTAAATAAAAAGPPAAVVVGPPVVVAGPPVSLVAAPITHLPTASRAVSPIKHPEPKTEVPVPPAAVVVVASREMKDAGPPEMSPYKRMALPDDKARVAPSPYCDFCLGDSAQNKKTSNPEELVSCSDCGRSGHPTCLQFTQNMIVSVRKYRWQCIECKCCSVCGTSDNDDQLLFCDDCDRGYHMYCLAPPLMSPPEGSWSCGLCLIEFHRSRK